MTLNDSSKAISLGGKNPILNNFIQKKTFKMNNNNIYWLEHVLSAMTMACIIMMNN